MGHSGGAEKQTTQGPTKARADHHKRAFDKGVFLVNSDAETRVSSQKTNSEIMRTQVSASQQRGQKLYQKGDFKGAIEAFGEVAPFSL